MLFCSIQLFNTTKIQTRDHVTSGSEPKKRAQRFLTEPAVNSFFSSSACIFFSQKLFRSFFNHTCQGSVKPIFGRLTISPGNKSPTLSVKSFFGVDGNLCLS